MIFRRIATALVVVFTLLMALGTFRVQAQSGTRTIQYGDTLTDTIDATNTSRFYAFAATQGDLVIATVTRKSGNLDPIVGIVDPTLPKDSMVLEAGTASSDGKSSTITDFEIPKTGKYYVEVIGDKNTTGKFTLSLDTDSGGNSSDNSGEATAAPDNSGGDNSGEATPEPTSGGLGSSNGPTADSIIDDFQVGNKPAGVVWSGDNLYVANYQDGTVSELDSDGNLVATIKVGGNPLAVAWDGSRLWVADTGTDNKPENAVTIFNPDGTKVGKYVVGREPFSMSYDADDELMWIADYADNKVVGVNSDGKVTATIKTTSNPNTVLYAPKSVVFVTMSGTTDNPSNTIMVIDTTKNASMGTVKVGKSPADLAWDATDQVLYVANHDDNTVSQFDIKNSKNNLLKVGKGPAALAWDGSHIWVALDTDKAVVALDPSDGSELAHVKLKLAPYSMISDGTGYVWVTQLGDSNTVGNIVSRISIDAAIGQQ